MIDITGLAISYTHTFMFLSSNPWPKAPAVPGVRLLQGFGNLQKNPSHPKAFFMVASVKNLAMDKNHHLQICL